jgi:hypothetical protein
MQMPSANAAAPSNAFSPVMKEANRYAVLIEILLLFAEFMTHAIRKCQGMSREIYTRQQETTHGLDRPKQLKIYTFY